MIAPELRSKVLSHLADPLKPLSKEKLGSAHDLVSFPTSNPKEQGGLTEKGKEVFREDPQVLAASRSHREKTRVQIHAVVATCSAFIQNNRAGTPPEKKAAAKEALAKGIRITNEKGEADQIQTTRKNGQLFTPRFKAMMAQTAAALSHCPQFHQVILGAAAIQKQQEAKEATKRQGIAEMA